VTTFMATPLIVLFEGKTLKFAAGAA